MHKTSPKVCKASITVRFRQVTEYLLLVAIVMDENVPEQRNRASRHNKYVPLSQARIRN